MNQFNDIVQDPPCQKCNEMRMVVEAAKNLKQYWFSRPPYVEPKSGVLNQLFYALGKLEETESEG